MSGSGPIILFAFNSVCRNSVTGCGFMMAELMLPVALLHLCS